MKSRGFTLLELVIAMVIMAIVAGFSVQFITHAVAIYRQGSERERLMSDVRFGLERLNREVRDAVPGSLRVEQLDGTAILDGPCVRFWPISAVSRYQSLSVNNGTNETEITLMSPADPPDLVLKPGDRAVVFPLDLDSQAADCIGNDCVALIKDDSIPPVSDGNITLQLQTAAGTAPVFIDSDTKRIYFAREQVRYCIANRQLTRAVANIGDNLAANLSDAVLMAEHISQGFFSDNNAGLYQSLELALTASQNNENLEFRHVIRLYNAP